MTKKQCSWLPADRSTLVGRSRFRFHRILVLRSSPSACMNHPPSKRILRTWESRKKKLNRCVQWRMLLLDALLPYETCKAPCSSLIGSCCPHNLSSRFYCSVNGRHPYAMDLRLGRLAANFMQSGALFDAGLCSLRPSLLKITDLSKR